MARQLRIEFAGACYHVLNRGVERRTIFSEDREYRLFLGLVGDLQSTHQMILHAYCLMPNHYHLLIQTPDVGLRRFMQELNSRYAQAFNRRHARVGPLFQGRYRALLVQADRRIIALVRYMHRNPVMAGLCDTVMDWAWSSAPGYLGKAPPLPVLETSLVDSLHGTSRSAARALMEREWNRSGGEAHDWQRAVRAGVVAGSAAWTQSLQRESIPVKSDGSVSGLRGMRRPPDIVRDVLAGRIALLVPGKRLAGRLLIYALRRTTSLTEREIAGLTGAPSEAAVAQTLRRLKILREENANIREIIGRLDKMLRGVKPSDVRL